MYIKMRLTKSNAFTIFTHISIVEENNNAVIYIVK